MAPLKDYYEIDASLAVIYNVNTFEALF